MAHKPTAHDLSRRHFLRRASLALGASALAPAFVTGCSAGDGSTPEDPAGREDVIEGRDTAPGDDTAPGPDTTASPDVDAPAPKPRVALISDTHVIDSYYVGPENSPLDTESILHANERFAAMVERLSTLRVGIDAVFQLGDIIHRYPFDTLDEFGVRESAIDEAAEGHRAIGVPYHACLGNHDYSFRRFPREATHELFAEKMGIPPYSGVDLHGFRFLMMNNFLGDSHDIEGDAFDTLVGTFGVEQLEWMDAQLAEGLPTFVMTHFPVAMCNREEAPGLGFRSLLARHGENILAVFGGHWHRWLVRGRRGGEPPSIVMGSTRYSADAAILMELDPASQTATFLNEDAWVLASHETRPWEG